MLQVDFSNKFLPSKMSFFSYHNFMNDCQDDKIAGNSTFAISNPVNIYLRWFFLKSINIKISLTLNFLFQIHKQKLGTHNPESCYFKKPIPDNNFLKEKLIYLLPKLSLEVLTIACVPTCINVEKPIDTAPAYLLSYKAFEILGPSIRVRKLRLRVSVKSKDIAEWRKTKAWKHIKHQEMRKVREM